MIPASERCFQKGPFFTKLKAVSLSACLLGDLYIQKGEAINRFFKNVFILCTRMKWFGEYHPPKQTFLSSDEGVLG